MSILGAVAIRIVSLLSVALVATPVQTGVQQDQSFDAANCRRISVPRGSEHWEQDVELNTAVTAMQEKRFNPHVVILGGKADLNNLVNSLITQCDTIRIGNGYDAKLILVLLDEQKVHVFLGSVATNAADIKGEVDMEFTTMVQDRLQNGDAPGAAAEVLNDIGAKMNQHDHNKSRNGWILGLVALVLALAAFGKYFLGILEVIFYIVFGPLIGGR